MLASWRSEMCLAAPGRGQRFAFRLEPAIGFPHQERRRRLPCLQAIGFTYLVRRPSLPGPRVAPSARPRINSAGEGGRLAKPSGRVGCVSGKGPHPSRRFAKARCFASSVENIDGRAKRVLCHPCIWITAPGANEPGLRGVGWPSDPSRGGRRPIPSGHNRGGAQGPLPLLRTTEQSLGIRPHAQGRLP